MVSDKAKKRLDAIREFSELGSGYKLAEFDLTLRGAGALLGNRQHGHVEALGYDYFLELLQQTIREFKGEAAEEKELALRVHFPYAIGEEYIGQHGRAHPRLPPHPGGAPARRAGCRCAPSCATATASCPTSMEKIFYVGAVKLFARLYGWEKAEVYADRVQVELGREIALPAGKDVAIPGLEVTDPRNCELEYHSLDGFIPGRNWNGYSCSCIGPLVLDLALKKVLVIVIVLVTAK